MQFSFSYSAHPDRRFAADAFQSSIGRTARVLYGEQKTEFTILKIEIEADGSKATVTGEIDDSAAEAVLHGAVIW